MYVTTRPAQFDDAEFSAVIDAHKVKVGEWQSFKDDHGLQIPFQLFMTTGGEWVGRWV
jgi:hypothetical protein